MKSRNSPGTINGELSYELLKAKKNIRSLSTGECFYGPDFHRGTLRDGFSLGTETGYITCQLHLTLSVLSILKTFFTLGWRKCLSQQICANTGTNNFTFWSCKCFFFLRSRQISKFQLGIIRLYRHFITRNLYVRQQNCPLSLVASWIWFRFYHCLSLEVSILK